ncbi:GNAT family N-acetyltransferase [Lysinibacillus piscis]|uniref:N-acetyltransferase domain-containing protein n=1 Tax=Lysinibacillus piscis TaxID=2518931 RepID=A0ABQ5NKJ8_9BACI|nr:GNAT family N-acetyltransferase [Lysinibacillus sp. KH24]GLC88891.1 hypothetical protein LYSBPC_20180 [Lysinibacillus sp. KH24]
MYIQRNEQPTEIIQVIHAAFQRYENEPVPSSALQETALSIQEELNQGVLIFGASEQDTLIAVVKCTIQQASLYFSRLAVLPSAQGKGVATQLLYFIEQFAIAQQLSYITCKVRQSEQKNICYYQKLGYRIILEETIVSTMGSRIPIVTMEKILKV